MSVRQSALIKRTTGIPGLDDVTNGGLPATGTSLILGEAGAGKSIFCLQVLAHAVEQEQGGVYVSFEESARQIQRNALSFTWGEALLASERMAIIDARPVLDANVSGSFELDGLMAAVSANCKNVNASWVVLDGIDRLLRLQPDMDVAINQIVSLNQWCETEGVSLLLTAKWQRSANVEPANLEGLEFLLDTVLVLSTDLVSSRLNRRFRVAKYRGTAHSLDELPVVMDDDGLHLPYMGIASPGTAIAVSDERVSSGIERLDKVLGGGVHRGSTTLISGQPGTAKTSLAASFAEAAAERGERVLYLSFDELADRIVRNVASININLRPHIDSGLLHLHTRESWRSLIEEHYIEISNLLVSLQVDFLIIDPVSALLKSASVEGSDVATERIIGMARARGITVVMTSLTDKNQPEGETTMSHVSTLADTWISLGYAIRSGERNRTLSVVKSRGSAHSNQVRELLLTSHGIDMADVYQYGSEVLMGTARVEKFKEQEILERQRARERSHRKRELEREIEQAQARLLSARSEAERLEEELTEERDDNVSYDNERTQHQREILRQRDPTYNYDSGRGYSGGSTSEGDANE